jgi:hypothetical protein
MILMGANPFRGPLEGMVGPEKREFFGALKNETFLGSEMAAIVNVFL